MRDLLKPLPVMVSGAEVYGSFPKYGDPNIDPQVLQSLLWGLPKSYPAILGNPNICANGRLTLGCSVTQIASPHN